MFTNLATPNWGTTLWTPYTKTLAFSSGSLDFPIKKCQNPEASQHVLGKALLGKLLILSPWLPIAEYPVIKHGNWKIHYPLVN